MKRTTLFLQAIVVAVTLLLIVTGASAQIGPPRPPIEPSVEAVLQVIIGSNDSADGNLPAGLRVLTGQLRANFPFPNYRLDSTYVGRLGGSGTFEYKSISNTIGSGPDSDTPTFLEWTLGNLRTSSDGKTIYQAEPFRFGARVPVRISSFKDEGGKVLSNVNYEAVGLTVNRVSLAANTPTLIGTISLPKTAGTLFLVLTVRPAE